VNGALHLAQPAWLLLAGLLPLLAWLHHRRPAAGLTYSRLPVGNRVGWRLHGPFYLRLAALALLVVALARPQLGYAWEESETEGIDIELVIDVSGSMAAEDFPPNRITVAKNVIQDFIAGRQGDRLGLVSFSGTALTRAPLTSDHRMLRVLVDGVVVDPLPRGTAIGVALATAARRLEASTAKTKVVVLVTDGDNNAGEIDPKTAAALCKGLGIKVYTIGVGAAGDRPVPVPVQQPDIFGRLVTRRQMAVMPVDEELLGHIAATTGGKFYRASDRSTLETVFTEIDQLEKTTLQVKRFVRYREAFMPLAWGALALLLAPLAPAALGRTVEP
jgi:Ca-activated chloride channel homolog